MGRKSGIFLIAAGAVLPMPVAFALSYYLALRLNSVAVEISVAPTGYALLAGDIGLAAWATLRGWSLFRPNAAT